MKQFSIWIIMMLSGQLTGSSSLSTVEGFGTSVAGVGKNLVNGFRSMGGYVPPGYQYSFCVFNGLQHPVTVKAKSMKEIMGAQFNGSAKAQMTINPGQSTGSQFNAISLYFEIECADQTGTFFSETHYQLGVRNDTTLYTYHTFQDEGGNSCAEEVGSGYGTSPEFMGVIYNNTQTEVPLSFVLGSKKITVSLEPQSFNYLTDVGVYQIRPNTNVLNFGQYGSVVVAQEGMGQVTSTEGQAPGTQPSTSAVPYNYEIYGQTAFESGMGPGNFAQPTSGAMRSITPMPCYIWNQSANFSQATYSDTLVPVVLPSESLWLLYTGPGWNATTQQLEQPFMGVIPSGQTVEAFLIRPRLQDSVGRLYLVRLMTKDQKRAQSFLQSIANGTLKIPRLKYDPALLTPKNIMALQQSVPDTLGIVQDAYGTQGYVMLEDVFLPYGLGSGPFYYSVPAPNYDVSQMFSTFTFLQTFSNSNQIQQMATALQNALTNWIQTYFTDPASVQASMKQFLLANGATNCVAIAKDGTKTLTPVGQTALNMMLYGPASITQLPICAMPGQNYQTQMPDGFPTSFVSFPVSD